MKIFGAFAIFLLALAMTYNVFADINSLRYFAKHFPILDNLFIDDNFFLKGIQNVSKIECTMACSWEVKCVSFFYNDAGRKCRLHNSGFYFKEEGTSASNWTYYMFGEDWCPVHDGFIHERSFNICIHLSSDSFNGIYEARSYCQSKGAAAISINTQSKVTNLTSILNKINTSYIDFDKNPHLPDTYQSYIGLQFINDLWTWDDGSVLSSVEYWGPNNPSQDSGRVCVALRKKSDLVLNWHWCAARCILFMSVLCEIV
ncbi:hypothetical protein ACF0H5_022922 [Mactra antiquata]